MIRCQHIRENHFGPAEMPARFAGRRLPIGYAQDRLRFARPCSPHGLRNDSFGGGFRFVLGTLLNGYELPTRLEPVSGDMND